MIFAYIIDIKKGINGNFVRKRGILRIVFCTTGVLKSEKFEKGKRMNQTLFFTRLSVVLVFSSHAPK